MCQLLKWHITTSSASHCLLLCVEFIQMGKMSYLNAENANQLYKNLKASINKLPAEAKTKIEPLADSLQSLINNSQPELNGVLPLYIEAQRTILLKATQSIQTSTKRKQTPISKTLNEIVSYSNGLSTFTNSEGDAVLNNIIAAVIDYAESLQ